MADDIDGLRAYLFDALRGLADKTAPLDVERARAMSDVAQTIINSVKVELEQQKLLRGPGSGFIPTTGTGFIPTSSTPPAIPKPQGAPPLSDGAESQTPHGTKTTKVIGTGATVTQHRMR